MVRGKIVLVAVGLAAFIRFTWRSDDGACRLVPASWSADDLDDETLQQIAFKADGTGEMSYAFNYIVHTDVRFRYTSSGDDLDLVYTRGTGERRRRVHYVTELRKHRCELRFDETPFPSDVESVGVETYSRR
jgi:hypothetical protein